MARRANAASQRVGIGVAGDEGGNEVGQLDPTVGRREYLRGAALAVQDLGPIPLAGVHSAALDQIAVAVVGGFGGDLGGLGVSGVVLPQPGVRREFALELGV